MSSNWYEIYPVRNRKNRIELSDYPLNREIFEKLQRVGILSRDANINNYDFDNDCSFINIYSNSTGELLYKYEIE